MTGPQHLAGQMSEWVSSSDHASSTWGQRPGRMAPGMPGPALGPYLTEPSCPIKQLPPAPAPET